MDEARDNRSIRLDHPYRVRWTQYAVTVRADGGLLVTRDGEPDDEAMSKFGLHDRGPLRAETLLRINAQLQLLWGIVEIRDANEVEVDGAGNVVIGHCGSE